MRDVDSALRAIEPDQPPVYKPIVVGGTWEAQAIDELAPAPKHYLIPKYRWSAFFPTYLACTGLRATADRPANAGCL